MRLASQGCRDRVGLGRLAVQTLAGGHSAVETVAARGWDQDAQAALEEMEAVAELAAAAAGLSGSRVESSFADWGWAGADHAAPRLIDFEATQCFDSPLKTGLQNQVLAYSRCRCQELGVLGKDPARAQAEAAGPGSCCTERVLGTECDVAGD